MRDVTVSTPAGLSLLLLALAGSSGCTPFDPAGDSAEAPAEFCSTLDDGGVSEEYGTAEVGAGSGSLYARVITDQSEDPRDPFYVAYRPYTLEPAETGGVQTKGTTSGDGIVEKTLGVGPWSFEVTWTRGSTTCVAEMELYIQEQTTTRACTVMTCPE